MKFKRDIYLQEMKALVNRAISKMKTEQPYVEIYTASIWTDPNAAASSISFDDQEHSNRMVQESNAWNKKHHDKYMAEGDAEQAKLFETNATRNCNPADFLLSDLIVINNAGIPGNWEDKTEGDCWKELQPALMEIGDYAFAQIKQLPCHPALELAVNGPEDWYEFTWPASSPKT